LADYAAEYENPATAFSKSAEGEPTAVPFSRVPVSMNHFHYDRFDTLEDEQYGKFSVNFRSNPQGTLMPR